MHLRSRASNRESDFTGKTQFLLQVSGTVRQVDLTTSFDPFKPTTYPKYAES